MRAKTVDVKLVAQLVLAAFLLIGEVQCIVKAVRCDWDPIGKAEIIYTASAVSGLGAVVGWLNIEDN
jgi:hypothetical protein